MPRLSALFHNYHKNQKQHTMSKMQSNQLKEVWMDLAPSDRYRMIGGVIDGMIYNPECVTEVREMLARWDDNGFLKSIILPDTEHDYVCKSQNKTSENKTTLYQWDDEGKLKLISKSLPDTEHDNMCHSCSGTGEGSTPETSCWNCKGHGAIIPNTYDYEG